MKVSELGEFGLIDLLARMIPESPQKQLILGIGDDTAAWRGDTATQLGTVDTLIEGVHFSLDATSWQELGWKALAINLSDVAAMGGVPKYALVALALPGDTEVAAVTALYEGMIELAQRFGVAIIGGNISRAPQVSITVTVLGSSGQDGQILTRAAARPGDKIAVTGSLGAAAAGLEMLKNKLMFSYEAASHLREAFLKPEPRVAEGQILVAQGVKAAIDISDGLAADLGHVCQSSKVGARVEVEQVPVDPVVRANFGSRALELALSGGEEYQLLFTAPAEVIDKVKKAVSCPVTVIGEIVTGKEVALLAGDGSPFELPGKGWEHFR